MYTEIAANKRKTLVLMGAFVAFLWALGWVLSKGTGNPALIYFFGVFAVVYAFISYFASAKIALALAGAKPIAKKDAPTLYRTVENLAITAGLPTPKIYIINDPAPNAFATGRDPNHAVVAVTSGLLDKLNKEELEGVIAHEMSHVGNYDIRLMAIVIMMVTIIAVISNMFLRMRFWNDDNNEAGGVMAILAIISAVLAPIVATLLQLAVSRRREYLADASGVQLTRYPEGLEHALEKIAADPDQLRHASPTTAHLYIANPFKSKGAAVMKLFSTHPPIEDRIAKLKAMESTV